MDGLTEASPIVAVVGSKPDPILPDEVDTMVFCNGGIYLLDRPNVRPRTIWHCITNAVLYKAQKGTELVRQRLDGRKVDLLIEISTLPSDVLDYSWAEVGYAFEERISIPNIEKGELTFSLLNARLFFDLIWSPCPMREKISAFWNIVWRNKKPAASTGILGLLLALKLAKAGNETFVLCGVGLDNDGYEFLRRPAPRGHICMDYCVLRSLSRSRVAARVFVTDKRLSKLVGLPLFEGETMSEKAVPTAAG